jgi:uncharacterized heparinase superfamily protein
VYPRLFDPADVQEWRNTANRMLRWLAVMSHPDGGIAFFNDAALDIAPDVSSLQQYARKLDLSAELAPPGDLEVLPASGYARLQSGPAVLIADAAPIGPAYLPGHAHADTLSFELSLDGYRALVNGGTSTYESGEQRRRERSTAMHNTVEVDGADSSEVWSAFRVARRARPLDVRWDGHGDSRWLEAAHDGYRRLPGRVTHRRRWELRASGLRVVDHLDGRFESAVARFRFAPGFSPVTGEAGRGEARRGGRTLRWRSSGGGAQSLVDGTWHPGFGVSDSCRVLQMPFDGPGLETEFSWN